MNKTGLILRILGAPVYLFAEGVGWVMYYSLLDYYGWCEII